MVTSTQKLLIILVAINTLIVIGMTIDENQEQKFEQLSQEIEYQKSLVDKLDEQEDYIPPIEYQQESAMGSMNSMSRMIVDIILRGLDPFPIEEEDVNTQIDKAFVWGLALLKGLIGILLILEIYLVLKNRKTT